MIMTFNPIERVDLIVGRNGRSNEPFQEKQLNFVRQWDSKTMEAVPSLQQRIDELERQRVSMSLFRETNWLIEEVWRGIKANGGRMDAAQSAMLKTLGSHINRFVQAPIMDKVRTY